MGKRNTAVILLPLLLAVTLSAGAADREISLGSEDGWRDIRSSRNVRYETGRYGLEDIVLREAAYEPDDSTDLLLHFDRNETADPALRYRILEGNSAIAGPREGALLGPGSAVFARGEEDGLAALPLPGALLHPGTVWNEASIEFWLYPALLEEGEIPLRWRGTILTDDRILTQEISCTVSGRRLHWTFRNVFLPPDQTPNVLTVTSLRTLVPRTWHHHLIRFDGTTGIVEYLIDGRPEGIAYATRSGRENGTVHLPRIGEGAAAPLAIAPDLTGMMDELRISRRFVRNPTLRRLDGDSGFVVSRVFDLGYPGSRITGLRAETERPGETDIFFYMRTGDSLLDFDENGGAMGGSSADTGTWEPVHTGDLSDEELRGRFVQISAELLPDGSRNRTPRLSNLTLSYRPDLPPPPPAYLTAEAGEGSVTLRWSRVPDTGIRGYRVYYGDEPGVYFGTGSTAGPSPLDVGNVTSATIPGLVNGRLYYFAVAAYDEHEPPQISGFSPEVSARPARIPR